MRRIKKMDKLREIKNRFNVLEKYAYGLFKRNKSFCDKITRLKILCLKYFESNGFETLEQWEARTGEKYPDDGPVWVLVKRWKHDDFVNDWELQTLNQTKNTIKVIANKNGKPPEDWRSE
jgi:hypothetical protein